MFCEGLIHQVGSNCDQTKSKLRLQSNFFEYVLGKMKADSRLNKDQIPSLSAEFDLLIGAFADEIVKPNQLFSLSSCFRVMEGYQFQATLRLRVSIIGNVLVQRCSCALLLAFSRPGRQILTAESNLQNFRAKHFHRKQFSVIMR